MTVTVEMSNHVKNELDCSHFTGRLREICEGKSISPAKRAKYLALWRGPRQVAPPVKDRVPRVLFLLADFAKGGISRYTANLLPMISGSACVSIVAFHTLGEHTDFDLLAEFHRQGWRVVCTGPATREIRAQHPAIEFTSDIDTLIQQADTITTGADHPSVFGRTDWRDKPVIVQLHSTCSVTKRITDSMDAHANCFVVTSEESRQNAIDNWGLQPDRIKLVELVVDPSRIACERSREEIRAELLQMGTHQLIDPGKPWILYYGRFAPEKRIELIAAAADRLGWVGMFAGDGWRAAETRREIIERAPRNSLILPWGIPAGELLRAADVFVCASDFEGGPTTSIEALLAGVPIASTDVGILQAVPGSYASAGRNPTPERLAEAIRRALELPDRKALAEQMRYRFSLERQADQWRELLQTDWSVRPIIPRSMAGRSSSSASGPCVHRGELLEIRHCNLCGIKGQPFEVFACGIVGECSIGRKHSGVQSCTSCEHRQA